MLGALSQSVWSTLRTVWHVGSVGCLASCNHYCCSWHNFHMPHAVAQYEILCFPYLANFWNTGKALLLPLGTLVFFLVFSSAPPLCTLCGLVNCNFLLIFFYFSPSHVFKIQRWFSSQATGQPKLYIIMIRACWDPLFIYTLRASLATLRHFSSEGDDSKN